MLHQATLTKLPGFKQLRQSGLLRFGVIRRLGAYRGSFKTFDEAQASIPASRRSTYDNDDLARTGAERFSKIYDFDWPVMFYLQKLIAEHRLNVVTDFGGHIGVKYYAYREAMSFPEALKWQVVEVAAMVREGRHRTPSEVTALNFFDRMEDTLACDLAMFSGVLQYAEDEVVDIIRSMPKMPRVVILNKVPVSSRGRGFVTLESVGQFRLSSRIFSAEEVDRARVRLGYELASSWAMSDHDFVVLSLRGAELARMVGQAWVLPATRGKPEQVQSLMEAWQIAKIDGLATSHQRKTATAP